MPKDPKESIAWIRKAADQNYPEAQLALGIKLDGGYGVRRNLPEAAAWFRKAAEQGHAEAQSRLACAYLNGDGVPVDYDEGVRWLRLAAAQNEPTALLGLGNAYHRGLGAPRDLAEARMWFLKWQNVVVAADQPSQARRMVARRLKELDADEKTLADGPEIFVTDPKGKRWYVSEVNWKVHFLAAAIPFALIALCFALLRDIHWLIWFSSLCIVGPTIELARLLPKYIQIRRERSYRARDRAEAERFRPSQHGVADQRPHGALTDDGTI